MEVSLKIALPGHHHPIYALEVDSGNRFFTAGNDKGIVVWDALNWKFESVLYPVQHSVYVLKRLNKSNLLLAGDRAGQLHIISLPDSSQNQVIQAHHKPIFDIAFSPNEDLIFVSSEDGSVSVWNTENWTCLRRLIVGEGSAVRCLAVHPNSEETVIAMGSREGTIYVYDYMSGESIRHIVAHEGLLTALTFDPKGDFLVSAARDAKLMIYDWRTSILKYHFVPHLYAVYKILFHPTEAFFVTASRDKDVKIWSSTDFKLKKSISLQKGMPAHRLSVNNIAWDHSGKQLISVSDDKMVLVWQFYHDF